MFKKYEPNKDSDYSVIMYNKQLLLNNNIGNSYYILLVSYFPLDSTQYDVFISLKSVNDKYGFLSRHLLSCARKVGVSKILLHDFYVLRKYYSNLKKQYSVEKYDSINIFFKQYGYELENLKNYLSFYSKAKQMEFLKSRLIQQTNLLIELTVEKIQENYSRKNKIHNILTDES